MGKRRQRRKARRSWSSEEREAEMFRALAHVQAAWDSYRVNLSMGAQRTRAIRIVRVVKAALDAYATKDERALVELANAAKAVLNRVDERHGGTNGTVDVQRFAPKDWPGWVLILGDPVREKGPTRSADVAALVNTLGWHAKRQSGPFATAATGEAFASWFLRKAWGLEWARELIPNADGILTLQEGELPAKHPARGAREKLARAFDAWKENGGDHEKLLRAGFRAVGVSKVAAGNLFNFEAKRAKRGGSRKQLPTAAE